MTQEIHPFHVWLPITGHIILKENKPIATSPSPQSAWELMEALVAKYPGVTFTLLSNDGSSSHKSDPVEKRRKRIEFMNNSSEIVITFLICNYCVLIDLYYVKEAKVLYRKEDPKGDTYKATKILSSPSSFGERPMTSEELTKIAEESQERIRLITWDRWNEFESKVPEIIDNASIL